MKDKKNIKFYRLLEYDFKEGTRQNRLRYLVGCGVLLFICQIVVNEGLPAEDRYSYINGLVYIFDGIPEYVKSKSSEFTIPVIWLLYQSYLLFLVGSYPVNDMAGYGRNILLFSRNRNQWWMSKCIWITGSVMLYYCLCYVFLWFSLALHGRSIMSVVDNPVLSVIMSDGNQLWVLIGSVVMLPYITSLTLSLLQMFLSFFSRPAFGYLVSICILVISVYIKNPLIIGNYSMMSRNVLFVQGGLTFLQGMIVNGILIIVILAVGNYYIKRRDIISGGD